MPVAAVAGETRGLDGEHCPDPVLTNGCQQPFKSWTPDASTRPTKIVINDRHVSPAKSASAFSKPIFADSD